MAFAHEGATQEAFLLNKRVLVDTFSQVDAEWNVLVLA